MGGLGWLGLTALGAALHWTINITFVGRDEGRTVFHLLLYITAWLLVLLGILGPITTFAGGPVLGLVALIIFGMVVHQYRMQERLSLLWLLGLAIEKEIPLQQMAHAYARERSDEMGWRAERLAELLEQGTPLGEALITSRNPLPTEAQLAVNLSESAPAIGRVFRQAAQQRTRFASEVNSYLNQMLYLTLVSLFGIMVLTFIALRLLPTIYQIILDFGLRPTGATALLIQSVNTAGRYAVLGWPLFLLGLFAAIVLLLHYLGWITWEPFFARLFTTRYHASIILRTLGSQLAAEAPLHTAIDLMAGKYPRKHMRHRLQRCATAISRGESWCVCLRDEGLIRKTEADVLSAAERVGNLPWALEEIADGILRRLRYGLNMWLQFLLPLFILIVALVVAITGYAILEPLQRIALDLANINS